MARRVTVVPQKAGMNLAHPIDGHLEDAGADWTMDQFTAMLLRDGSIKLVEKAVGSFKGAEHSEREAVNIPEAMINKKI